MVLLLLLILLLLRGGWPPPPSALCMTLQICHSREQIACGQVLFHPMAPPSALLGEPMAPKGVFCGVECVPHGAPMECVLFRPQGVI